MYHIPYSQYRVLNEEQIKNGTLKSPNPIQNGKSTVTKQKNKENCVLCQRSKGQRNLNFIHFSKCG